MPLRVSNNYNSCTNQSMTNQCDTYTFTYRRLEISYIIIHRSTTATCYCLTNCLRNCLPQSGKKLQENSRGHFARQDENTTRPQKSERQSRRPSIDRKLEEEKAAAKIQAGYRGYETRKQQRSPQNTTGQNPNVGSRNNNMQPYQDPRLKKLPVNSSKRQNVEKQSSSSRQTGNREFNPSKPPRLDYDATEEEAATKIQAGVRGYQTRKHISEQTAAATKIQACFRGYQERKYLASVPTGPSRDGRTRQGSQGGAAGPVKAAGNRHGARQQAAAREDSYEELDREHNAALTIQSHYRGYLTRKDLAARRVSPRVNLL